MARVASHLAGGVRKLSVVAGNSAPGLAVLQDRLRQSRFLAVMRIARRNGVNYLHHFPRLAVLVDRGALVQLPVFPIKAPLSPGSAQQLHIVSARGRGRRRSM